MIKYDDVKNLTTEEYFHGNKFSIDAFNKKYSFHNDDGTASETYVQALKRVCDFVASVEKTQEQKKYWSERWFDEIVDGWWHPAGSIMQGAGSNRKISLANCTTLSLGLLHDDEEWDNLESIMKNASYSVAKAAAYRQGLGIDFSRLRPRGTTVLNSAKESTGAIHWMQYVDNIAYFIGQKGRIPAFLFSISINHPDVKEFITVKSDYTKIQNANISIQVTDKFYKAVDEDLDWKMEFNIPAVKKGQKVYVDVHSITMDHQKDERGWYYIATHDRKAEKIEAFEKARKLLELIAKNMYANAEPGLQNIDIARKYSNSDALWYPGIPYDPRILSTNACCVVGETKVLTDFGWLTIEEIYNKINNEHCAHIMAMSYNKNEQKYELLPILAAFQQRNDYTVELTIEENNKIYKIECSKDHPILTKNRGYVEAIALNDDDDIVIMKA